LRLARYPVQSLCRPRLAPSSYPGLPDNCSDAVPVATWHKLSLAKTPLWL